MLRTPDVSIWSYRRTANAQMHAATVTAIMQKREWAGCREQTCHLERADWPRCRGAAGRDVREPRLSDALGFPGDTLSP